MPEFYSILCVKKHVLTCKKLLILLIIPDFNFFKGVAGYYHPESYQQDHWNDPNFTHHMKNAPFNKRYMIFIQHESIKNNQSEQQLVDHLSKRITFFCATLSFCGP